MPRVSSDSELEAALASNRPAILRHCYRMVANLAEAEELTQDALERAWNARDTFKGDAPVGHWLMRIATNACLNALARKKRRALPRLENPAATSYEFGRGEPERWLAPAPDALLFPHGPFARSPEQLLETKESVALAFLELLQRLSAKQRAALLLKDVAGWSAEEISEALDLSVSAVNSALHRAREMKPPATPRSDAPASSTVAAFVDAWETRDLEALVALLKRDVVLSMPPYPAWFQGVESVSGFFQSARFASFWSSLVRVTPTEANGLRAFLFQLDGAPPRPHSVMLVRFERERVAEMVTFVGEAYFEPFCRVPAA
ncbi:MAG: RNA polymerase subunit sigma-70 [Myxococcales bacterium]|nr:RNA polymerase subunit sigma-70 [Myxococcales bacterium]